MRTIYSEILSERDRQIKKWGEQNHPSVSTFTKDPHRLCEDYEIPGEERAKFLCRTHADRGDATWTHIAIEELSEAVCANSEKDRRQELIQLAAVCIAWIDCIDRKVKK